MLSVHVWVVLMDLIKFEVSIVAIWMSGPDVANTGAQINPGNKKTALAIVFTLIPSSGIDLIEDMINIRRLE